ncbi:agamous-like MADS-box protein AGL29 [Corylus avellana]|uniref:agamous-like MADS-box protein AGL29 n=1 Tax=Corylus avellana TaxID=13451 RepID=UPI00286A883C|nr:agamous-like MADS-box protein AGL29 [Corylus avellana]
MVRPRGMGRSKIEIKKIENKDSMYSTFTKRRNGLFRKVEKLSTLCGVDVAAIVFSPKDKLYAYGQPSVNSVVDRFLREEEKPLHGDGIGGDIDPSVNSEIMHGDIGDFVRAKQEKETTVAGRSEGGGFLSNEHICGMELHELEQCKDFMEELMKKVADRVEETVRRRVSLKDFLPMNSSLQRRLD